MTKLLIIKQIENLSVNLRTNDYHLAKKRYMMTPLMGKSIVGFYKNTCISPYFLRIDNTFMMRNALYGE